MKSEKELSKEKIDKKDKFYEEMCMNGIAEVIAIKLEKELEELINKYNLIKYNFYWRFIICKILLKD